VLSDFRSGLRRSIGLTDSAAGPGGSADATSAAYGLVAEAHARGCGPLASEAGWGWPAFSEPDFAPEEPVGQPGLAGRSYGALPAWEVAADAAVAAYAAGQPHLLSPGHMPATAALGSPAGALPPFLSRALHQQQLLQAGLQQLTTSFEGSIGSRVTSLLGSPAHAGLAINAPHAQLLMSTARLHRASAAGDAVPDASATAHAGPAQELSWASDPDAGSSSAFQPAPASARRDASFTALLGSQHTHVSQALRYPAAAAAHEATSSAAPSPPRPASGRSSPELGSPMGHVRQPAAWSLSLPSPADAWKVRNATRYARAYRRVAMHSFTMLRVGWLSLTRWCAHQCVCRCACNVGAGQPSIRGRQWAAGERELQVPRRCRARSVWL
jgi:hypothetical protein